MRRAISIVNSMKGSIEIESCKTKTKNFKAKKKDKMICTNKKNKRNIQSKEGLIGINISKKNLIPDNDAKNLIGSSVLYEKGVCLCAQAHVLSQVI